MSASDLSPRASALLVHLRQGLADARAMGEAGAPVLRRVALEAERGLVLGPIGRAEYHVDELFALYLAATSSEEREQIGRQICRLSPQNGHDLTELANSALEDAR